MENLQKREIVNELKESYLDYAMSVIVSRALPDVRDGLKPVHRRILWAMWDMGLTHQAKFVKSARVVGECLGKYHPHGDMAVYDALVRMAQDFSLRYPLIQGQGNFGSTEDNAAAPRYTEAKLSKISEELLVDIEKETIDWQPNYDATQQEPKVLPAKLPNLLLSGSMGIAVGMATNIPSHNLGEVVDAIALLIDRPEASIEELIQIIKGPDFPTGGIIYNKKAILEAYATGRGSITTRAVAEITETKAGTFNIVITEIPYQVNKAELITKMALLVETKKINGIKDIRDESDREGLRILVELKNDTPPQKVLNMLFQYTDLQKDFHFNMLALKDGVQPEVMSLKNILEAYINHRQKVITRRSQFDLTKAKEREHILLGLSKALKNIDRIIQAIKKSENREEAHQKLVKNFNLSDLQAEAILDMRLASLAALEQQKIEIELKEKKALITKLEDLLKSPQKIRQTIKEEVLQIKEKYADERRTKIVAAGLKEFQEEDLILKEEVIITLTKSGYIKRLSPTAFRVQKRGGKGIMAAEIKEEDFLSHFLSASTHDDILFFTDRGRVFQTKVYEIPAASRISKGKLIQNFLEIPSNETISAIVSYSEQSGTKHKATREIPRESALSLRQSTFLVMATKSGIIKKTPLKEFLAVRRTGIIAIKLRKNDSLQWVKLSSGQDEVFLASAKGQSIRFSEKQVRSMGRVSAGVIGIRIKNDDALSGMDIIQPGKSKESKVLVVMEKGFAKQTPLKSYRKQKRGGRGIKTAKVTNKTGEIISAHLIDKESELLIISARGQILRTNLSSIRLAGRATQGVKIINLKADDKVKGVVCL